MSESSRRSRLHRSAIVMTALVMHGAAPAEIIDRDTSTAAARPARTSKPAAVEPMARTTDAPAKSVLKCWQEGRLVFESTGVSIPDAPPVSGPTFKGADGRAIRLLDMRQALCILERSNG